MSEAPPKHPLAVADSSPRAEIVCYEPSMREEWNALVERSPEGWLFHTRDFLDGTLAAIRNEERSLVVRKSGRLVAVLPLSCHAPEPHPKLVSAGLSPAGPALDPSLGPHEAREVQSVLWERAREIASQQGCRALTVALPVLAPAQLGSAHGVSPLDEWGFAPASTSTYIVVLDADPDALFARLRTTARQMVRRAEKAGVTVRHASRPGDLDLYYAMHCDTYRRTGVTPHPRAYFEAIFGAIARAGLARVYAAEREGRVIGFVNVARYKRAAQFWTGCSTEEALEVGANYLLQWHAIREAREEGLHHYEVGEAFPGHRGDKLAGLDAFKSAFGGERWPFHKGRIDLSPAGGRPSRGRLSLYYLKRSLKALVGKA